MVDIALKRGDLQKVAKARLIDQTQSAFDCVEARYRPSVVLARIASGYELVYHDQDPELVAETERYVRDPSFQKVLNRVAARAPEVGASAAYEEGKSSVWRGLTDQEREHFREFAGSSAGKFYLSSRSQLMEVNQRQLSALANEVATACSR